MSQALGGIGALFHIHRVKLTIVAIMKRRKQSTFGVAWMIGAMEEERELSPLEPPRIRDGGEGPLEPHGFG
jgi:hypothetical protein